MDHEDMDEGAQVERDNIAIREAMLLYNSVTDNEDRYTLARSFAVADTKVIVPVYEDPDDPEGIPEYRTLYKHDKATELHVFTSATLIPESCDAPGVCLVPLVGLLTEMMGSGEVDLIRIDPGTPHGVGIYIKDGKPQMFRLPVAEAMARSAAGGAE